MTSPSVHSGPVAEREASLPFRRILVASSLDGAGTRALLRAAHLPLAPGARIVLLHVVRPPALGGPAADGEEARRALARAAPLGRSAAHEAGARDLEVLPRVAEGWPATEIARAAWRERAELIVVGPPGGGGEGSSRATVSRIVRRAELPVLVAREDPSREYRRVLCGVGRSVTAADTVVVTARVTANTAREITLLHAFHRPFEGWLRAADDVEREAVAYLRGLAAAFADDEVTTRWRVRQGDPALQLVRAAREERADLLAIGARPRTGVSRLFLESAADWVIENGPSDVLVARAHRLSLEAR